MRTDKWLAREKRKSLRFRAAASSQALKPIRFLVSDEDATKRKSKSKPDARKQLRDKTVKESIKD
jgi:hypothetical protein